MIKSLTKSLFLGLCALSGISFAAMQSNGRFYSEKHVRMDTFKNSYFSQLSTHQKATFLLAQEVLATICVDRINNETQVIEKSIKKFEAKHQQLFSNEGSFAAQQLNNSGVDALINEGLTPILNLSENQGYQKPDDWKNVKAWGEE